MVLSSGVFHDAFHSSSMNHTVITTNSPSGSLTRILDVFIRSCGNPLAVHARKREMSQCFSDTPAGPFVSLCRRGQIAFGISLALLDLFFHTRFSLYTFFYAGFLVGAVRLAWLHVRRPRIAALRSWAPRLAFVLLCATPVALAFVGGLPKTGLVDPSRLVLHLVPPEQSGIGYGKSDLLDRVDARVRNVAKWLLSVGDAVAVADVDMDGRQDLFLTQTIKASPWRGKLWLNEGGFRFRRRRIRPLEPYLDDPARHGLPSTALFLDYDNDGHLERNAAAGPGSSLRFRR